LEALGTTLPFKKRDDGSYDFPLPLTTDAPFAIYSVAETRMLPSLHEYNTCTLAQSGAYALAAFNHPEEWINKDIRIASEFITAYEMAKTISDV
jgi:hypothetical protein